MKKKILSSLFIIILTIGICCTITKATAGAVFKSSKSEAKQGESFTVTLSVSDTDGINGVVTEYSYDESLLELQESKIGGKLVSLGQKNKIETICNSENETSLDVITLTFKVKEDAQVGKEANVNTEEVLISSFGESDSTEPAQNVKIKIIAKEESENKEEDPTKEDKKEEDNKQEDKKEESQKEDTKKETITPEKKDESAPNTLPKTGIASIIIFAIIGVSSIIVISFALYKKYSDI